MNILFVGYTYIRESYRRTFLHYPEKDKLFFLLPHEWKARGGQVKFQSGSGDNIFKTKIFFYHSHYPIIGGLLKGWMPAFPFILWKLKKTKQIRLVFGFSEPTILTTLYNGLWTKLFGLKFVMFSWENIPNNLAFRGPRGLVKKLILKANLSLADGLIGGNRKGREIYAKLTKKPLALIPPFGLDTEFFRPVNGEKSFDGHDLSNKVVFTFAGAIAPRKGVHILIEAFGELVKTIPEARLIMVGNDETGGETDQMIKKFNLENYVLRKKWLNHQQLKELLAISDIFVYPSIPYGGWEEQFGYSMAEALLMELPVISTKSGSIEDVVQNRGTGILVEPNNVEELFEAMKKLGINPELRKKMGRAGRKYVNNNFSYEVVANKFYEFFCQIFEK